jgi:hypothetical protein
MTSAETEPPPADAIGATETGGSTDTPAKPTRMTRSERQAGVAITGVMVAAVALSWAGDAFGGDSKAIAEAAIGLGLTALLGAAVWYGQRIITCFAAIMAGLAPMKPAFVYLPFVALAFGGYLMFRTSQAQKKAAVARPRRPPRQRGAKAGPRSAKEAASGDAVRRPTANRRYTPPKSKGGTRRR